MNFKKISSLQHPLVKHLVKLKNNSDYREEHQSAVIEGYKTIIAVSASVHFQRCFLEEGKVFSELPRSKEYFTVTKEISKKISNVVSPEGILVESPLPRSKSLENSKKLLVLDGVSDPGNLGTLLRTALAFGWRDICLITPSVDLFNDKVIRSSKGASFLVNYMYSDLQSFVSFSKENHFKMYIADLTGKKPEEISHEEKLLLILGNESRGVHSELRSLGQSVTLPINDMESLNVAIAGSILMYLWKGF